MSKSPAYGDVFKFEGQEVTHIGQNFYIDERSRKHRITGIALTFVRATGHQGAVEARLRSQQR